MHTPRPHAAATIALGLAAALALTGCTINIGAPPNQDDWSMHHGTAPRNPVDGSPSSAEFSHRDLMFAVMMIPHHQQAIDMSELALERSGDAELRALAEQIRDAQAPEIEQMQGWLDDAGVDASPGLEAPEMGMGMGMLSDDELAELEQATGSEFDRQWLEHMIAHHEGAIRMTRMVRDSSNDEVRALADSIVESQTAEIEQMEEMLGG